MSEFECRNGHLMRGYKCAVCGSPVYTMDGMTNKEIEYRERAEERREETETEEEQDERSETDV